MTVPRYLIERLIVSCLRNGEAHRERGCVDPGRKICAPECKQRVTRREKRGVSHDVSFLSKRADPIDATRCDVAATEGLIGVKGWRLNQSERLREKNVPLRRAKGRLNLSRGRLGGAQGRLSRAQGRLSVAQGRLSHAQGRLCGAQGRSSCAKGRLSRAQGRLSGAKGHSSPLTELDPQDFLGVRLADGEGAHNVLPINGRAGTRSAHQLQEAHPPARSVALAGYVAAESPGSCRTPDSDRVLHANRIRRRRNGHRALADGT